MSGYTDLRVWHRAMDLATLVYALAPSMPKRAVRNDQPDAASGCLRAGQYRGRLSAGHQKGFARFIAIARGSLAETQTYLLLAVRVGHLTESEVAPSLALADELSRMLTRLKRRLDAAPLQS